MTSPGPFGSDSGQSAERPYQKRLLQEDRFGEVFG